MMGKSREGNNDRRRRQNRESRQRWRQRNKKTRYNGQPVERKSFSVSEYLSDESISDLRKLGDVVPPSMPTHPSVTWPLWEGDDPLLGKQSACDSDITGTVDCSLAQNTDGELGYACTQSFRFLEHHVTAPDLTDTRSLVCHAGEMEIAIHDHESCILNSVGYTTSKSDHDSQDYSTMTTDDGSGLIDVAKNSYYHDPFYQQTKNRKSSTEPELASYEKEKTLTVQKAIKDVQELYTFGVRVGFLMRDERVRLYLENMRAKYEYISFLRDTDGEPETITLGEGMEHANTA